MVTRDTFSAVRRFAVDFAIGLAAFFLLTMVLTSPDNGAGAGHLPTARIDAAVKAAGPDPVALSSYRVEPTATAMAFPGVTERRFEMTVLGVVFAAIAAINLAFWRHLRRVYASPRRGRWGRD